MQRDAAENLVNTTFTQPYDEGRFCLFLRNLLPRADVAPGKPQSGTYIPESFRGSVQSFKRMTKFVDADGNEIDVLAVKLSSKRTLENARTGQRNFIAHYLNGSRGGTLKDAALVAFYSDDSEDWRFSLVRMDYEIDAEKGKIKKVLTPAQRYSFLVGAHEKTHTAQKRLAPALQSRRNSTLDELRAAFDIEVVTDEFFEEYKKLYLQLKESLDGLVAEKKKIGDEFKHRGIETADFAKRTLGQIVFLYFLQKKGWLGVEKGKQWGSGPKDFLQQLYGKRNYGNFFNDVLEYLFYEALAIERYTEDHYFTRLECKVPFLNGGLFEPFNNYKWDGTDIPIEDEIFGDIFRVFDQFNFTVREDEPLDKEVAVDPEMLGKVFEKLIPENERKGSGAFYTPREIVHYMCQESLINFLDTKLNMEKMPIKRQGQQPLFADGVKSDLLTEYEDKYRPIVSLADIETFIHHGDIVQEHDSTAQKKAAENGKYKGKYKHELPKSIRNHAKEIDTALANIKICDPAIGSGAFPVGVMNEIVRIRSSLNHYLGEDGRTHYDFKRHAIQESIYGVDLEPSAVDIAKLRLWLSLVVDEENFDSIKPLPNLDYKIRTGNSLLGISSKDDVVRGHQLRELENLKAEYFSVISPSRKTEIKRRADALIGELTATHTKAEGVQKSARFDYHVYFSEVFSRVDDGFDIVIANPPYISIEKFSGTAQQKIWRISYDVFASRGDIYCLFFELGFRLLRNHGSLCYITSNKYFRAGYGKKLREYMTKWTTPLKIIDFGELPVFDAATDPAIVLAQNTKPQQNAMTEAAVIKEKSEIYDVRTAFAVKKVSIQLSNLSPEGWGFGTDADRNLIAKIKKQGKPLEKCVNKQLYMGLKTGFNDAFVISKNTRDRIILSDKKSKEIIKPWLRGKDSKRWHADLQPLYVIVIPSSDNKTWPWSKAKTENAAYKIFSREYPAIAKHMKFFRDNPAGKTDITMDKRADKGKFYWELRSCAYYDAFDKPKIIYNEISKNLHAFVDYDNLVINNAGYIINAKDAEYILGIMNSNLFDFFYRHEFPSLGDPWAGGRIQFRLNRIAALPIIEADNRQKKAISSIVDKIQAAKKRDKSVDVSALEKQIDKLVYELYGLSAQEIAIVEESVP